MMEHFSLIPTACKSIKNDEPGAPFVTQAHPANTRLIDFQLFFLRLGRFDPYLPAFKHNLMGMHFNYTF